MARANVVPRASARRWVMAGVALVAVSAAIFIVGAATSTAAGTVAVPVTIDTDLYSSVDDVGAVAVAFGLQQLGEARVIAIGLDTRTERPQVTPAEWKCTAAIAQFYNSAGVPIGSDGAPTGTTKNDPDWATP